MLVAKAKEQEVELCHLSHLQALCAELQKEMEAEKTASLEYQQETQVRMCIHILDTRVCTVISLCISITC